MCSLRCVGYENTSVEGEGVRGTRRRGPYNFGEETM